MPIVACQAGYSLYLSLSSLRILCLPISSALLPTYLSLVYFVYLPISYVCLYNYSYCIMVFTYNALAILYFVWTYQRPRLHECAPFP